MAARPELIRLKYSSDGDAAIRAAIATTGSDPIQTGELVVGVENFKVKLYSKDATGRIVEAVSGSSPPIIDGGDFNTSVPVLNIGDPYGGGYFAGLVSYAGNGIADYALIVSSRLEGDRNLQFKTTSAGDPLTTFNSVIDGFNNTQAVNDSAHPAAQFCRTLNIEGYTDWYIPSRNEMDIIYYNLKPDLTANVTSTGLNVNAITDPPANGYTASDPTRTTAVNFQSGGPDSFLLSPNVYWTSTRSFSSSNVVTTHNFSNGGFGTSTNNVLTSRRVRAIRKIPL
jgi:hypothetical protein